MWIVNGLLQWTKYLFVSLVENWTWIAEHGNAPDLIPHVILVGMNILGLYMTYKVVYHTIRFSIALIATFVGSKFAWYDWMWEEERKSQQKEIERKERLAKTKKLVLQNA